MFIAFEGGEGSGKSTQAKSLFEALKKKGYPVVITREPGATELGKRIRSILLGEDICNSSFAEMFLIAADRAEHIKQVVRPALEKNKIVITDRYIDSSIAYQVGGRQLPEKFVRQANQVSSDGLIPDITILLDMPVEQGLKRAKLKSALDRFEREGIEFHARVKNKYLELAADPKRRYLVLSGTDPLEENKQKILKEVEKLL